MPRPWRWCGPSRSTTDRDSTSASRRWSTESSCRLRVELTDSQQAAGANRAAGELHGAGHDPGATAVVDAVTERDREVTALAELEREGDLVGTADAAEDQRPFA